jgi:pyruvate kinase
VHSLTKLSRAKIICTIGPSSNSYEAIMAMTIAGMHVARLNFSHGTHEDHRKNIETIRRVSQDLIKPIAIVQDLQGPKIRVQTFKNGAIELKEGATFTLTTRNIQGDQSAVSVSYASFPKDVKVGDTVLLDDGMITLEVQNINGPDVQCQVIFGGHLSDRKGLNLPGATLSVTALTDKDIEDLKFGLQMDVDYVALSFVQKPQDIYHIKQLIAEQGKDTPVIAKIEKPQAVQAIDQIIEATDLIMVARGDLGVELRAEEVPPIQKKIIKKCNERGKPVITATQMLDSMIHNPRPTRAEASDVANAILDGSDAVMLSGETASGKYPIETVETMHRIISLIEEEHLKECKAPRQALKIEYNSAEAIGHSACTAADLDKAAAIVCLTQTGSTAQMISHYRPTQPIIAVTHSQRSLQRMALLWGVAGYIVQEFKDNIDDAIQDVMQLLKEESVIKSGDRVVITAGLPFYLRRRTNMLRIEEVE